MVLKKVQKSIAGTKKTKKHLSQKNAKRKIVNKTGVRKIIFNTYF